ncbi:MAG: HRDC domain-containing protein [Lewinellaceae bacterium]|nr:HRDC domain-containing protein [Lewinellaceae bacterium]
MPRFSDKLRELDDSQKLLFQRLKEWRKEKAAKEGLPAYLVATNAQFIQMIRLQCRTLESFKNVKGFGKKRTQKYGKRIIELIKGFYESEEAKPEVQPGEELASDGKEDMPY